MAIRLDAHIQTEILDAGNVQIPFVERLFVHRADVGKSFFCEIQCEVARDEPARAGDDNQIILLQGRIFFDKSFLFHISFVLVLNCVGKKYTGHAGKGMTIVCQ